MKDVKTAFKEKSNDFLELIEKMKFSRLTSNCTSLLKTASMLELKKDVFIFEVFESIFKQIESAISEYKISSDKKNTLKTDLLKYFKQFNEAYKNDDSANILSSLIELRYVTTRFQFDIWDKSETSSYSGRLYSRDEI